MKKGVIVLLLLLALVVIISPRLVGQLAQQTVDENLNWAADTSSELVIASEGFDRGWFSSQGLHRVELGQGSLRSALETLLGADDATQMPALLIETHLDHGLIPVSSMRREGGSLAPGLGSAVSTLIFESGNGDRIEIPGKILSTVGLSGNVQSNYVLDEGAKDVADGSLSWQPTNLQFSVDPKTGESVFEGVINALSFSDNQQLMSIADVVFSGETSPTPFGFSTGEANLQIGDLTIQSGVSQTTGLKQPLNQTGLKQFELQSKASIDDSRVSSSATLNIVSKSIPAFGEFSIVADIRSESDAAATGALSRALQRAPGGTNPMQLLDSADAELKNFLAGGATIDVEQLDVTLPMGQIESQLHFSVPRADTASFDYSALLLSAVADFDVKVPGELVEMAVQLYPQVGMVVGLGYLKQNGDVYELNAQMKNGLLTLNGAPIPLPFGAIR